jgi:hypothetical protein
MTREPVELEEPLSPVAAREDLSYIRRTLEAAGRVSSISGVATALIGLLALGAGAVNAFLARAPWEGGRLSDFLVVWAALLAISAMVAIAGMAAKARRTRQHLWTPVLFKALSIFAAPMALGGVLTLAVVRGGQTELFPVIWLGAYGAGLAAAGHLSVSPVRWMGFAFLFLAGLAALLPASAGMMLLAAGFGGLHIVFGGIIAWRHNG